MKRFLICAAAAVLLIVGSGAAFAEEAKESKEGAEVEVGIKAWMNKMKRDAPAEKFTSDSTILIGPAVEAKFQNNIFVEASYLFSASNYKADVGGTTREFDRADIDLAAGYMITHQFGAFAGYRNSAMKEKGTGNKETSYGPIVGVLGSVPVNEPLSIYGKLTYLFTRLKSDIEPTRDAPGWIAEIGARYEFTKELSANLGYQYETTKTKNTDVKDTFSGFTLGAMYAF